MKFFLLAGLEDPLARALEARNARVLDPSALLFAPEVGPTAKNCRLLTSDCRLWGL